MELIFIIIDPNHTLIINLIKKYMEFSKIQRGNGVSNDSLATLAEIMEATYNKMKTLENKIEMTDKKNTLWQRKNYRLLVISVVITTLGIIISKI
jgi:hypothetical protein